MKKILMAMVCASLVYGCAQYVTKTEGRVIDQVFVKQIEPGVTPRKLVIDMFGEPKEVRTEDGVETLVYEYVERRYPTVMGYTKEDKAKVTRNVLEIRIKNDTVSSYKYKSVEG